MYKEIKQAIIDCGNELIKRRLTRNTGGNISVYIRKNNVMLITPGSTPYHEIEIDDIVEMDLEGNVLNKEALTKRGRKLSSEWRMHAIAYKGRKDISAFVHAHPVFCMAVSTLGKPLPAIDYLIAYSGNHEVQIANYATYGSSEIAEESWKYLKTSNAVLLENHGINTVGPNLPKALKILDSMELLSEMYWRAKVIGEPKIIDKEKIDEVIEKFQSKVY